jgi:hypothetical protein
MEKRKPCSPAALVRVRYDAGAKLYAVKDICSRTMQMDGSGGDRDKAQRRSYVLSLSSV